MEKNLPHIVIEENCCVTTQETLLFTHVPKSVLAQPDLGTGTLVF